MPKIKELAKDIIFGQMRVVIATMNIEEINSDRDKLIANIANGVEVELKKVGLRLINVNIQDVTDESGYIDALGQEAASKAINEARIKVAQADRDGQIGASEAQRDQRIQVANANAEATKGENLAVVEIANSNAGAAARKPKRNESRPPPKKWRTRARSRKRIRPSNRPKRSAPSATRPRNTRTSSCPRRSRAIA